MAYIQSMNIAGHMKDTNSRMANIEVAMAMLANCGLHRESGADKNHFHKEVLEREAIANVSKFTSASEYRMCSKKVKSAYEQVRLYARKILRWLDTVTKTGYICRVRCLCGEHHSDGGHHRAPQHGTRKRHEK